MSNSYASSLWVIDFLFDVALGGSTGVNMHGGGQAPGYTPIADDSGGVIEARPEYYGLLLFALAGSGTLLQTQLSAGGDAVTAYALRTPSGGLNLILVNKDTSQNSDADDPDQPEHSHSDLANHDGGKPGCHLRSQHSGRHGKPGRQFCSRKPGYADCFRNADDLFPSGTQRHAYQHHLI